MNSLEHEAYVIVLWTQLKVLSKWSGFGLKMHTCNHFHYLCLTFISIIKSYRHLIYTIYIYEISIREPNFFWEKFEFISTIQIRSIYSVSTHCSLNSNIAHNNNIHITNDTAYDYSFVFFVSHFTSSPSETFLPLSSHTPSRNW